MEEAERVGEAGIEQRRELSALFVGEVGVEVIGLRVFEVDFLVRHVEVAAGHYGLLGIELEKIGAEVVVPFHAVVKAAEPVLRVRSIDVHQEEILQFNGDDTPFVVMSVDAHAESDRERRGTQEDSRARVALLVCIVPERPVTIKADTDLPRLQLGFLQTDNVGIKARKGFLKTFLATGTQTVDVPRD